jgi:hypothetical protein
VGDIGLNTILDRLCYGYAATFQNEAKPFRIFLYEKSTAYDDNIPHISGASERR